MNNHLLYLWLFEGNTWWYILLPLIAGALLSMEGWDMQKGKKTVTISKKLLKEIQMWKITDKEDELPTLARTIQQYWEQFILSSLYLCFGIALVVLTVGGALVSFLMTGSPAGLVTAEGNLFPLMLTLVALIGSGCGTTIGIWRVRQQTLGKVNYADMRQRQSSDYRSPIFLVLIGAACIALCIITLLVAPYIGPLYVQLANGQKLTLSSSNFFIFIIPCTMLCCIALLEWFIARVVAPPRLLISSNPTVSQHADDMMRSWLVGLLQGEAFWIIGTLYQFQHKLLWSSHLAALEHSSYAIGLEVALFLVFLLGYVFIIGGLSCYASRGRLSGGVARRIKHAEVMPN